MGSVIFTFEWLFLTLFVLGNDRKLLSDPMLSINSYIEMHNRLITFLKLLLDFARPYELMLIIIFSAARKLRLEKKVEEQQGATINVIEIGDLTRRQKESNSNKKASDDEKGTWKNTECIVKDEDSPKNMSNKNSSFIINDKNKSYINETLAVTEIETIVNIKPEISINETNNDFENIKNVTGNEVPFENTVNEDQQSGKQQSGKHLKEQRSIKIFVPLLFKLLRSPIVVFLDLSVALIFLLQTSIGLFLPKIIQNLFNQSTATAGLLSGTLQV